MSALTPLASIALLILALAGAATWFFRSTGSVLEAAARQHAADSARRHNIMAGQLIATNDAPADQINVAFNEIVARTTWDAPYDHQRNGI